MSIKKKKKLKRRKPKGKPLSEALREREESRRALEPSDEDADEGPSEGSEGAPRPSDLASEPPPSFEGDEGAGPEHPAPFDDEDERDPDEGDPDEGDEDERADDEAADDEAAEEPSPSQASAYRTPGEVEEDEDDEEGEEEAQLLGHRRYVTAGFFGLWLVAAYVLGRTLEGVWSRLAGKDWFVEKLAQLAAIPHEGELVSRASLSMVLGAILGGLIVLRYYYKPEVRTWADEVAEELSKVKWPTRKDVGNNTVVVIAASAIITLYLMLLDRFWGFVTNLIYTSGV